MASSRNRAVGKSGAESLEQRAGVQLRAAVLQVYRHLELDRQLMGLLGLALELTGAERGFVFAPGEDLKKLHPVQGPGTPTGIVPPASFDRKLADGWLGGEHISRFDGMGPLREVLPAEGSDAAASTVALRFAGEGGATVGLVWLMFDVEPGAEDIKTLSELVELVRPAIANGLQVRTIRELVIKDDTARCYNRRYFEEFLPEEMSRASRFKTPLSLIFFDLDNLKQVNNDHGHAMGSRTLLEVSVRVRSKIRRFDRLFRFGGDEFCIVLPETEWHGALEVAERVRTAISGRPFLTGFVRGGKGIDITASFGVASFPLHAGDKEGLVRESDRAMQKIKGVSKNAVGVAEIAGGEDGD